MNTTLDEFITLFRGRADVYGSWEGSCVKQPLNRDVFENHLWGNTHIGVYPLVPHNGEFACVWGCSDIDVDDLDAARNLETAFTIKGITAHVEKTRKGYHIWVFAKELVPAATMRRAFLAAHQVINYPAKEVNPKQENPGKGFGNYVRLPYPGELAQPCDVRYMLDEHDNPKRLIDWIDGAHNTRTDTTTLDSLAAMWTPPTKAHVNIGSSTEDVMEIVETLPGLPYMIWRDGPLEGRDRSITLFRLAHRLADAGLTAAQAFIVVRDADKRWGKFHLRSDGEHQITKMITAAYGVPSDPHVQ